MQCTDAGAQAHEWISDVREHVLLGEQQFGLFEGVDWSELEKYYPNEVEYYRVRGLSRLLVLCV